MRRIFTLAAAALLLAACSAGAATEPSQTPDRPRYTRNQAARAFIEYDDPAGRNVLCFYESVRYEGDGFWSCGFWTFDERTGRVFRDLTRD